MSEQLNSEFFSNTPDISLEGFITNILNKGVSDATLEEMFKDIYKQDENMAKEALDALDHSDREELALKMAKLVLADKK